MGEALEKLKQTAILLVVTMPPVFFSVLVAIVALNLDVSAEVRYFELVAQIIPVFVLALVVEQKYFFQDKPPKLPIMVSIFPLPGPTESSTAQLIYGLQAATLLIIMAGETGALWAVAEKNSTAATFALATAGLVAAVVALVMSSLVAALKSWLDALPDTEDRQSQSD